MSLRVLLADESDTIKKVFQLALQDFNAEVKAVHSGLDVIDVALAFKPDIIFTDVLLQKKNGYDTCLEIKQHLKLKQTPVVLMWSSFMELDQSQFKRSSADDQLEKPFDADFLRGLVKKYVPSVAENPMAQFLNFPKSFTDDLKQKQLAAPEAEEENTEPSISLSGLAETSFHEDASEFNQSVIVQNPSMPSITRPPNPSSNELPSFGAPTPSTPSAAPTVPPAAPIAKGAAGMGKTFFDALNQINSSPSTDSSPDLKISKQRPVSPVANASANRPQDDSWKSTDLNKFKVELDLKPESLDKFEALNLAPPPPPIALPETDEIRDFIASTVDKVTNSQQSITKAPPKVIEDDNSMFSSVSVAGGENTRIQKSSSMGMDDSEIEAIVRAHTEEFIKTEIKKGLFDLMEKIVREEISKVLEEELRLKQELSSDQP